ncbi:ABC transporter [Catellatospora sp. TT07R-123]|uniref:ABC transporter ATP-binding protein n=1 Tax=Catellatospora sp. TT07R-123 TaxID=2733863 RepID=UPI001B030FED|nr:ABC transporter ATP-binding protein [Catellatospora sp. TT07R-123]GHJ47532.1 ABC transporter [Catellatospora sp. TT07R-123]
MTDHEPPLVEAAGLGKTYPAGPGGTELAAVRGIDLRLHRGEALGLLGTNGAGKSTTMRMLAAVSPPTFGTLRVLGMDPLHDSPHIRARLGVVPQDDMLDQELTVRENLLVYGRYFGLSRAVLRERTAYLIEFAALEAKADAPVTSLSGGMRRRLTIARALINQPSLLLLDEPTTGLDPQARQLLWDRLTRLKQDGVALIVTTHYMDEAEQLCDRVVIMERGAAVADGTPRELIEAHALPEVVELRFTTAEHDRGTTAVKQLIADGAAWRLEELPDRLLIGTADGADTLARVEARVFPRASLVRRATLEDVFLSLTGRALVD